MRSESKQAGTGVASKAQVVNGKPDDLVLDSVFDAPVLAGNVAHELTDALFALHLHLDPLAASRSGGKRRDGMRRKDLDTLEASRPVIETILSRLDELSRGLRLVAGARKVSGSLAGAGGVSLANWWPVARVVLNVSIPKGIDLRAEWPTDLPAVRAEPSELTACTVAIIRRAIGSDRIKPPCTLRLVAFPEGRWIRLMAVAHSLSEELAPDAQPTDVEAIPNGSRLPLPADRFRFEPIEPCAASVLIARVVGSSARRVRTPPRKHP